MKYFHFLTLIALGAAAWIGLTACDSTTSGQPLNPYSSLSCSAKIDKMGKELRAFEAAKKPVETALAKRAVLDPSATDSTFTTDSTADTSGFKRTEIKLFRGYPPVSGLDPNVSDTANVFRVVNNDPRGTDVPPNPGDYQVQWIPPVGYNDTSTSHPQSGTDIPIRETTNPVPLPQSISVIQIISTEAYRAHISIYDFHNRLLRTFDQEFGYQGEMQNIQRVVPKGLVSFLAWDNLDAAGREVIDVVYLWKIRMTMASGQIEDMTQKTGYIGSHCLAELAP